jgi:hypothetical protein
MPKGVEHVPLPEMSNVVRCVLAALCFLVGAVFAVSAYSVLKRYQIVEKGAVPGAAPDRGTGG